MAIARAAGFLTLSIAQAAVAATGLIMDSPEGDYIGQGQSYYYTPSDGTFAVSRNYDNGVSIRFSSTSHYWNLDFAAPGRAALSVGTYDYAARFGSQAANQPGLEVSGDGRGSNGLTGSFTVKEVVYGDAGQVVAFDATFAQRSGETGPPLRGEVLFRSSNTLPPRNHFTSPLTAYATDGVAFGYQIKTSRANASYAASGLPPGLTINRSTGLISGTPTAQGSFQVQLSTKGMDGNATGTLSLTVDPPGRSTGPYSAFFASSDPGEPIGHGKVTSLVANDAIIITPQTSGAGGITFTITSKADYGVQWRVQFAAPVGSALHVGVYDNAALSPASTRPGLHISSYGYDTAAVTGSFNVKELEFDPYGHVLHFHASFIQHTDAQAPALAGDLHYESEKAVTSSPYAFAREEQPFSYQIIGNNQPASYSATGLPPGLALNPKTGKISGTPSVSGRFHAMVRAARAASAATAPLIVDVKPAQSLGNISTRVQVTGNDEVIGGFIVTGAEPKKVIVRAIGPSLTNLGVSGALPDPNLELYSESGSIGRNDDWRTTQIGGAITDDQRTAIEATGVAPSEDVESAILATLPPGSYTAIVRGFGGTTGVTLVEVYDLDLSGNSQLANISTRGFAGSSDDVMIGGFIMAGAPGSGGKVVIRALGPSLAEIVSNVLPDPTLELRDANGGITASNNDWKDSQETEIENTGLAPSKPTESAILTTLPIGSFTAVVRGNKGATGNALVEVYNLP